MLKQPKGASPTPKRSVALSVLYARGFTLIELLVVIAIIGLLSTMAIVVLGTARLKSRDARRLADLKQIQTALELYYNDANSFPTTTNIIQLGDANHACLDSMGFHSLGGCTNPYLVTIPKDPMNGYYVYSNTANDYAISTALEGTVNSLSGIISASPNGGIYNGSSIYGLVGWWNLDEGGGGTAGDSSLTNNTGSWFGLGTHWVAGKVGHYAGQFNGGGDYLLASPVFLTNAVTFMGWFNANSFGGSTFGNFKYNSNIAYGIDFYPNTDGVRIAIGNAGPWSQPFFPTTLTTSTWTHGAVTYDGTTLSVYINGQRLSFVNSYRANFTNTQPYMGVWGSDHAGGGWFNGLIDDVREYNRALSQTEVQALYNSQK